jgi:hypothetical protein
MGVRYLLGVADQVASSFFLTVMVTRPEEARAGLE